MSQTRSVMVKGYKTFADRKHRRDPEKQREVFTSAQLEQAIAGMRGLFINYEIGDRVLPQAAAAKIYLEGKSSLP